MGVTRFPGATTRQVDFNSSGTWTCPSGVYSADFLVVGAGGGGGGVSVTGATMNAAGGGGGGGAVKNVNLAVTPGTIYTITVGAKGTGSAGAIGGNGGFSEVLLSGTTLVRSYGGQGGGAVIAGVATAPTISRIAAGGGGRTINEAATFNHYAGGGGGAVNGLTIIQTSNIQVSSEAVAGSIGTATIAASAYISSGSGGIDGYGAGGSGGWVTATTGLTIQYSTYSYNAGAGAVIQASGGADGGAAIANTGCGGGGAGTYTNATSRAGGNGADGLVRVVYFA